MTAILDRPAASKFILHPIVFRIRTLTHSEYRWRMPARCPNHLGRCGISFPISTTNGWSTRILFPVYTLGTINVCGSHPSMLIVFKYWTGHFRDQIYGYIISIPMKSFLLPVTDRVGVS